MAVAITHAAVATLPDQAGAEINKAEWNAAHTISGLATVAGTGAYSDLTGQPTLGTAAASAITDFDAAGAAAAVAASAVNDGDAAGGDLAGTYPNPTIGAGKVTYAKIQNVSATSRILGRITAGAGSVEELTAANAKTILAIASTDVSGLGTLATQSGTFSGTSSGTNTGDQTITLTTDVTGSGVGSFAATIAAAAVTLAKMANRATQTFIGRNTAGSGVPEELSVATAKTMLNLTGTNSGDQTITLTTDVTGSGSGSFAATIAAGAVTLAKMENRATQTLIGRNTAGSGVPEELSVATAKTMLALTGTNSGDQTITLTGDVTGSGTGSFAATLANVVSAGTGTKITANAKGLVTTIANASLASADFANQGTTTTVLHGNAAGNPAFGAVALGTDVSGTLAAAQFPALTGDVTTSAGSLATAIGAGRVTRAMLGADAKNWTLLGTATASGTVRTGTITWVGTFEELWFEYFISGYSGSAIGRLIVGPTAGLSEVGTTFATAFLSMTPPTTVAGITSVSIPGWPTAVTAAAVSRYGWMKVQNVAAQIKRMVGEGQYAGTAATTAPTIILMGGNFTDSTNLINKAELAVYDALTGTAISTTTFNAGTYLNVWGRHTD